MKSLRFFKLFTSIFILSSISQILPSEHSAASAAQQEDNKRNSDIARRSAAWQNVSKHQPGVSIFQRREDEENPGLPPILNDASGNRNYQVPFHQLTSDLYQRRALLDQRALEQNGIGLGVAAQKISAQKSSEDRKRSRENQKTLSGLSIDGLLRQINYYIGELSGKTDHSEIDRLNDEIDTAINFIKNQYLGKKDLKEKYEIKLNVLNAFRDNTAYFYKIFDLAEPDKKEENRQFVNRNFEIKPKDTENLQEKFTKFWINFYKNKLKTKSVAVGLGKEINWKQLIGNTAFDFAIMRALIYKFNNKIDSKFMNLLFKIWPNRLEGAGISNTIFYIKLLLPLILSSYANYNNLSLNKLISAFALHLPGKTTSVTGNIVSYIGDWGTYLSDLRDYYLS